ncbi:type III-B CRISPR module RAMP protein Cmr6 [Anaerosinus sp.]|uniref:type III-B CRISPR module RAMP protein Cmr6 n=1 Tax=Selenobaculum sp. TaxID=3074374 RepID=UPI003AB5DCD0
MNEKGCNRHYYFHLGYYEGLTYHGELDDKEAFIIKGEKISERNESMIAKFTMADKEKQECYAKKKEKLFPDIQSFSLQTQYPGLLLGIGDLHNSGIEGEIMAGFSLDYVTGLPIIPGSSIKGVLRAAFLLGNGIVIREMLADLCKCNMEKLSISSLITSIFGSLESVDERKNRDVFFDAWMMLEEKKNAKDSFKCLGLDSITPHRQTDLLELAEPVPLTFLKVLPEVRFKFNFLLHDTELVSEDGEKITILESQTKKELFQELLCTFGIGAKTNVGYGVLKAQNDG